MILLELTRKLSHFCKMAHRSNAVGSPCSKIQWRTRQGVGEGGIPLGLKISGQTLFSGQAQVAQKSWKDKKYFNTVKKFRANSVFQGKSRLFKILIDKKYIFNTVNSGHTLFFRSSTSCSKVLKGKKYFNTVKSFRATPFFRARKLFKNLNDKKSVTDRQGRQGRAFLPCHNREMCKTN